MTHPVKVYSLDELPQLMGQFSLPVSRLARGGMPDEDDVDVDLAAAVISWVAQFFAQGEGAILCFLPVRPSPSQPAFCAVNYLCSLFNSSYTEFYLHVWSIAIAGCLCFNLQG